MQKGTAEEDRELVSNDDDDGYGDEEEKRKRAWVCEGGKGQSWGERQRETERGS